MHFLGGVERGQKRCIRGHVQMANAVLLLKLIDNSRREQRKSAFLDGGLDIGS